jgi:hypothetical protein
VACHAKQWLAPALLMVLIELGLGCDRHSADKAPAPPDPWKAKLDALRAQYEANQATLLADWRSALRDAQAGDVDADKLAVEIANLRQRMGENQARLEGWDKELVTELHRRGINPSEAK